MTSHVFVSQSNHKAREVERLLGSAVRHRNLDLDEIQAVSVDDVVRHKVRQAFTELGVPVMIEDTGLHVDAWNGLPGALIKWFIETVGAAGICTMLNLFPDRSALAVTVIATYDGEGHPRVFRGEVRGHIAPAPAGQGGFGWDAIFIPLGSTKTFGEMSPLEKDEYSMRRHALRAMRSENAGGSQSPTGTP